MKTYISALFIIFSIIKSYCQHLELVKDIATGNEDSEVIQSVIDGDDIYLVIKNTDNSQSLFFYNASTNTSNLLLSETDPITRYNNPFAELRIWNHKAYFLMGSIFNRQLWNSDGTNIGTTKIYNDIGSCEGGVGNYGELIGGQNVLYFYCTPQGSFNTQLWRTDGTTIGTFQLDVTNESQGMSFTNPESNIFYYRKSSSYGSPSYPELWASNGNSSYKIARFSNLPTTTSIRVINTPNKALIVKDSSGFSSIYSYLSSTNTIEKIMPESKTTYFYSSSIKFSIFGDKAYFNYNNPSGDEEIWVTNGTIASTHKITNASSSTLSYKITDNHQNLLMVHGYIKNTNSRDYCMINTNTDEVRAIRKSNGNNFEPHEIRYNIPSGVFSYHPSEFIGSKHYALAQGGFRIIEVDTTSAIYIEPLVSSYDESFYNIYAVNGKLLIQSYIHSNSELKLYVKKDNSFYNLTDSLPNPKPLKLKVLANTGSYLYFSAFDPIHGTEVWVTDGTSVGTHLTTDFNLAKNASFPNNLVPYDTGIFLHADDGLNLNEVWYSGGNEQNTIINNIWQGVTPYIGGSIKFGNDMYTLYGGNHLLQYNKTEHSFIMASPLGLGPNVKPNFTILNNDLYYSAYTDANGTELFKIAGGAAHTCILVKDINPNYTESSTPDNLTKVGNQIYFTTIKRTGGNELWRTDGTTIGTIFIKDLLLTAPKNLTNFNNNLLFVTDSSKIWRFENSGSTVSQIYDSGSQSKIIDNLIVINNELFFLVNKPNESGLYKISSNFSITKIVSQNVDLVSKLEGIEFENSFYFALNTGLNKYNFSNGINSLVSNVKGSNFTKAFNKVYFKGNENGESEIWQINIGDTVQKAFDINPGSGSSNPQNFTLSSRNLFFSAYNPAFGTELYKITDCPFNKSISTDHFVQETVQSVQEITSIAKIKTSDLIIYDTGGKIDLLNGFDTEIGANFETILVGCGNLN